MGARPTDVAGPDGLGYPSYAHVHTNANPPCIVDWSRLSPRIDGHVRSAAVSLVWAEDSDSDRFLIREALEGTPFETSVVFAADGEEALRHLARRRPAGVVLDINMPGMDGITALRRIRRDHGDLPVIMFSTANDLEDVRLCRELGIVAYAVKPVDFASFRIVVSGIVAHFQDPHGAGKREPAFIARLRA